MCILYTYFKLTPMTLYPIIVMLVGGDKVLKYKIDIIDSLKQAGYSTYKIRNDKLIGEAQMQKIRTGEIASKDTLNTICRLLDCQPGDILVYVEDNKN
jgi:putative transcriptional regulator